MATPLRLVLSVIQTVGDNGSVEQDCGRLIVPYADILMMQWSGISVESIKSRWYKLYGFLQSGICSWNDD